MSRMPTLNRRAWSHLPALILFAAFFASPAFAYDHCSDFEHTSGQAPSWFARQCVDKAGPSESTLTFGDAIAKAGTDTAYALNLWFATGDFVSHPVASMASPTLIATNNIFITGLDFSPDLSTLFAINRDTNQFGTLDLGTAAFTSIGALDPPTGEVWVSMVVDPVAGTIYGLSLDSSNETGTLLTIDPGTAAQTTVGPIDADVLAASMNCDGEMYAVSLFTNNLYQIDPATGDATLVGALGVDLNFAQEIDFDNDTGILYHWMHDFNDGGSYGTLDLSTGAYSPITDLASDDEFVGAIRNQCSGEIFTDGFESGSTSAWSATVN